jgi:putative restriction endonuclease
MQIRVAITDLDWFTFLATQNPDEVNFWQPSGGRGFRALSPGEPLLFKLHSPNNFIVGGGFFSHFTNLPVTLAWEAFGEKNGARSLDEMRARVRKYRNERALSLTEEVVGCIMLQQPFFFAREDWISVSDWPPSIQQGKNYNAGEGRGAEIWADVQHRLGAASVPEKDESVLVAEQRYGKPQVILPRLGQGAFRLMVTDNYDRQCAVTGTHILPILDASHIKPYGLGGTHSPMNGLLLRRDLHTLFDDGYVTVTPEFRLEVSKKLREEFNNGDDYYKMHGKRIHLPATEQFVPAKESLIWHNENVFKA